MANNSGSGKKLLTMNSSAYLGTQEITSQKLGVWKVAFILLVDSFEVSSSLFDLFDPSVFSHSTRHATDRPNHYMYFRGDCL